MPPLLVPRSLPQLHPFRPPPQSTPLLATPVPPSLSPPPPPPASPALPPITCRIAAPLSLPSPHGDGAQDQRLRAAARLCLLHALGSPGPLPVPGSPRALPDAPPPPPSSAPWALRETNGAVRHSSGPSIGAGVWPGRCYPLGSGVPRIRMSSADQPYIRTAVHRRSPPPPPLLAKRGPRKRARPKYRRPQTWNTGNTPRPRLSLQCTR